MRILGLRAEARILAHHECEDLVILCPSFVKISVEDLFNLLGELWVNQLVHQVGKHSLMAVKLELHLRKQHPIHQVHSLVNDLRHLLVHAHDNQLVYSTFEPFFVNVLG